MSAEPFDSGSPSVPPVNMAATSGVIDASSASSGAPDVLVSESVKKGGEGGGAEDNGGDHLNVSHEENRSAEADQAEPTDSEQNPPTAHQSAAQQIGYYYQPQNFQASGSGNSEDSPPGNAGVYEGQAAFLQQFQQQQIVAGTPFLGTRGYNPNTSQTNNQGSPSLAPQDGGDGPGEESSSPPESPYFHAGQSSVGGATTAAVSNMIYHATHGVNGNSTSFTNQTVKNSEASSSSLEQPTWSEGNRTYQQGLSGYPQTGPGTSVPSPPVQSAAVPVSYQTHQTQGGQPYPSRINSGRGPFDEMLPPSAVMEQHSEQGQSGSGIAMSGYFNSVSAAMNGVPAGGTLFAQQPWYGGTAPHPDVYSSQQRLTQPPSMQSLAYPPMGPGMNVRHQHMAAFYHSAPSTPGPPIQTTSSNKGPDGANLFIFHIPNHFTNQDMFQLFRPYGNLLSVRIMVEKDTGRSRGFGFVSYDLPESAATAIKELNGYVIGNKRLKVQHKQIRSTDSRHNPGHNSSRSATSSKMEPSEGSKRDSASLSSGMGTNRASKDSSALLGEVGENVSSNEKSSGSKGTPQEKGATTSSEDSSARRPAGEGPSSDGKNGKTGETANEGSHKDTDRQRCDDAAETSFDLDPLSTALSDLSR